MAIEGPATCRVYVARLHALRAEHPASLDEHEARRRAAFRFAADRDRFTLGAVLLRGAVAEHYGVRPSSVAVDRACDRCGAQHGRPRLALAGVNASVSHSGDLVVVALSTAGPVGVDVELVGRLEYRELLASVCAPAEQAFVLGPADFYTCWTRKEAVLKATGEGLRRPMTEVTVTPPQTSPTLLTLAGGPPLPCRMADLAVGDGYAAAAAVLTGVTVGFDVHDAASVLARR